MGFLLGKDTADVSIQICSTAKLQAWKKPLELMRCCQTCGVVLRAGKGRERAKQTAPSRPQQGPQLVSLSYMLRLNLHIWNETGPAPAWWSLLLTWQLLVWQHTEGPSKQNNAIKSFS